MNLRETITACDRLREKSEGIGLSDGLIEIIEFAYAQGIEEGEKHAEI